MSKYVILTGLRTYHVEKMIEKVGVPFFTKSVMQDKKESIQTKKKKNDSKVFFFPPNIDSKLEQKLASSLALS